MSNALAIPGVRLTVYKQDRCLTPEEDGHVGQLYGGYAVVLALVDSGADTTIGLFRDGQDHYVLQKDLLTLPELRFGKFPPTAAQKIMKDLVARDYPNLAQSGAKAFGVKMTLRVDESRAINTVNYPENMLMLAQYRQGADENGPGHVVVWKVALVSQYGEFFLTVQEAYNVVICKNATGKLRIPRLKAHRLLERLIVENMPKHFECATEVGNLYPDSESYDLAENEAVVARWYDARNMGSVITKDGMARVHWSQVPPRPRRRYLVPGERITFRELQVPQDNPETKWRKMRSARFNLQVAGVEIGQADSVLATS